MTSIHVPPSVFESLDRTPSVLRADGPSLSTLLEGSREDVRALVLGMETPEQTAAVLARAHPVDVAYRTGTSPPEWATRC